MSTPPYEYESATDEVYNAGVVRTPNMGTEQGVRSYRTLPAIWADVLHDKDVVGGQVAQGFKARAGAPLAEAGTVGVYEVATDMASAVGILLMSTDAYDAPRQINVIKGGSVRTDIGHLADVDEAELTALADALKGRYDATFKAIKF